MEGLKPKNLKIRFATTNDAQMLSQLGQTTFNETYSGLCSQTDIDEYVSSKFSVTNQKLELEEPQSYFLVAEKGAEVLGYAKFGVTQTPECLQGADPIELERMYVLKQHLGQGIGKELLKAGLIEAKKRGHKTLWLMVWEKNLLAQKVWRLLGFEKNGTTSFAVGRDIQTDLVMSLRI